MHSNAAFDRESFSQWLRDPVTRKFFKALKEMAAGERLRHADLAWAQDVPEPLTMAKVKERARILEQIADIDLDTIMDALAPPDEAIQEEVEEAS